MYKVHRNSVLGNFFCRTKGKKSKGTWGNSKVTCKRCIAIMKSFGMELEVTK